MFSRYSAELFGNATYIVIVIFCLRINPQKTIDIDYDIVKGQLIKLEDWKRW